MNHHRLSTLGAGLLALTSALLPALQPARAAAQMPAASAPATDSAKAPPKPLFTLKDLIIGGAFAATTVAMFPLDERLAKHITNAGAQENRFYKNASTGVEAIASPGAYVIGGTLYAVGRIGRFQRVADLGWHGTEAVFIADVATYALKGIMGRSRPFVSADTNARDFKFMKGFGKSGDRQSFPSGHATSAFAAAAAVTAETGRWWPKSTIIVGPLMYGGATMVGLSRMYHNRHWASDVVLGAAIGTFAGQKVVQYSHAHGTRIDRLLLAHVSALPDGRGGYVVSWSAAAP